MGHYQEIVNLMLHSLKTAEMVYTIKNKQVTAAAASWNVQEYFIVRSELNEQAGKKIFSVDEVTKQ